VSSNTFIGFEPISCKADMMAKRSASPTSTSDSSPHALNEHLSNSAQQHLAVLRRTLESRLKALEEVLADPSRGESLPGLILDLSRVATEEAQAAASQACLATRSEADKEIAALRASAKAALDAAQASLKSAQTSLAQEQATGADLRRAVEQATVKSHKQAELMAAREQLEAGLRADRDRLEGEVVRQQSIAADLQRAAGDLKGAAADAQQQLEKERKSSADWQSQLEAERAAGTKLRQGAETVLARLAGLERDLADERSAHEAAVADLTEARAAGEAERAAGGQLRQSAETAVARLAALERDLADERSAHEAAVADLTEARAARDAVAADLTEARAARDAVAADLARERGAASDREPALAQLQSQLEAERATVVDLRQAAARAEELSATLTREASKGHEADAEVSLLQKSLAEARKVLAEAQAELEAERTSMAELRQAAEYADQQVASARSNEAQAVADGQKAAAQLAALAAEREAITDELTAARKWINDLRDAEAEFALPPAPPHVDAPPAYATAEAPTPVVPARAPDPVPIQRAPDSAPIQNEPEEGWQAVRINPRFLFAEGLLVQVNGDPARLFDISISGCQLLSPTALKPNQIVKVLLPLDKTPVSCSGKVVWTRLEPMAAGQPLGYRAGVRFTKADERGIEKYAARHASPP
jgi:hypothetical protein